MKHFNLISSLLIFLTTIQLTYTMHWASDTQLRDLEYNGVEFVGEASHWSCSSLKKPNNNTYDCNGVYYLGGFDIMGSNSNNYFQRTYYTLPTHNQIKLSFTQFAMDNCDNPDRMDIRIDGNLISGFIMDTSATMAAYASPICGAAGNDYPPFTATFTYPHTSTTSITIQMIMNLDNNVRDESIAFRDVVIDFLTVTTPTSSMCAISSKPLFAASYACACPLTNQYQNPLNSGTCSFCDSTCATCSGSAATQCTSCYPYTDRYYVSNQCLSCYTGCATCTAGGQYQCTSCKTGYYLANDGACYTTCDFPLYTLGNTTSPLLPNKCLSPCISAATPYLYWDGTCQSTCASPLTSSSTNSYPTCTYPCTEFQYAYWNGSCLSTCPYPLTTRVQNYRYFCDFPCADTTNYLLWDASCSTSCASTLIPLVQVTEASRKYCRFQCTPSQYLYWNGSCLATCPYPLTTRITNSRLFCDFPCSTTTNYLYWNGSCLTGCAAPLSPRTEGTSLIRYYCDYPCGVSTDYLYWNGTCSTCLSPLKTRIDADNNFCDFPCATTEWLYWDGTCQTSCASPLVQDIQGSSTTRRFCQYYCGMNQYMYWNGSCIDTCEFPLSSRYTNSRKFCDFPCTAPMTEYLYWNGSCISSCALPLSPRTEGTPIRIYCDYPCTSTSDYLYWNTTCGSCNAPLIKRVDAKSNFCDYPCQPSEWLYWDSSCNTTCPSPALTQVVQGTPSRNYCTYQCGTSQYLLWNGTCADSCDTPLISGTNNGRNFCYYPCLTTEYVYPNGTCTSSCSTLFPPKTVASRNYCTYPCSASQVLLYDGTCLSSCDSPYVLNVYSNQKFCDLPCPSTYYWVTDQEFCNVTCYTPVYFIDTKKPYLRCIPSPVILEKGNLIEAPTKPETVTILTLFRPMNYMRYLEISMPERLDRLAASRGRNVLATYFGLQIKSSTNISFYRDELPYVYIRHNVQSSFLINYWQDLITLLIGIAAALFFFVLEKVSFSEGWELLELISRRIRVILMWNYVLMVFAWNIDDLILFVAVEYMTLSKQPEAPASTPVSFLLSLFFLALMLGFIYGAAQLIQRRRHLLKIDPHFKKSEYSKNFDLKYENYQVVYRGFKDNYLSNQFFFLIYMFRIALPMIIAVSAIKSPKTVAIFALTINVFMLLYLFIMRPFKKLINQIQLVFYELIIFMMNVCVLILTLKSPSKTNSVVIIGLGDAIIIGNDIINILILVFLVVKIYIEATAIYKDMKRLKRISTKEKVTTYLQLLSLPIQQDNMGFEEMINYYCPPPKPWFEPLVKRLFNVVVTWFSSLWNGMISDCKECFSSSDSKKKSSNNRASEFGEFEGELVDQSTIGGNSSRINTKGGRNNNHSQNGGENNSPSRGRNKKGKIDWKFFYSAQNGGNGGEYYDDEEGGKSKDDLSQLDGLPTYDAIDKLNRVNDKAKKAENNDISNGEIRLINQDISINAGYERGNHLDHLVHDDFTNSRQYNMKYARNKVVPVSPQPSDMSAIGGRPILDNTDLNLEPFLLPSQASPQDQNILVISNNNSQTNLNTRRKRGRINNFGLKLDSSDIQGNSQNPHSGIPDNLSPISRFLESNQITPVNPDSDLSKNDDGKSQAVFVKKDYEGHEWSKDNESPAAFDLDDSFDKNKKKVVKRKKRIQANFKLSDLPPDEAEEEDKDYIGWKPYKGKQI